jgi:hypothetical protein
LHFQLLARAKMKILCTTLILILAGFAVVGMLCGDLLVVFRNFDSVRNEAQISRLAALGLSAIAALRA